jgi:hypothetical protein
MDESFVESSAIVTTISEAAKQAGFLVGSSCGENLYENGKFKPRLGLILRSRDDSMGSFPYRTRQLSTSNLGDRARVTTTVIAAVKIGPSTNCCGLSRRRGMSSPMTTSAQRYEVLLRVSSGSTAKANVMYF